jgi:hypothetical protein
VKKKMRHLFYEVHSHGVGFSLRRNAWKPVVE